MLTVRLSCQAADVPHGVTMSDINEADREAARQLREVLADISGFWHKIGDEDALCLALARHRSEAERRVLEGMTRYGRAKPATGLSSVRFDAAIRPPIVGDDGPASGGYSQAG